MTNYFAYIRVSTAKQGERGVSLQEQKSAILAYSGRNNLHISRWFEETETAAKRGRPVFSQMIRLLKRGNVQGVIIHKIDRSARNLRDWTDLGELSDAGHEIHFANESLDMTSRGGRLSADIQAVVAADYIRNLREEARKGFYGRIKQGLFPLPAPIGYLDRGGGQPKIPDPMRAPIVRKLFERYATGTYNLRRLTDEANLLGLRNRNGATVILTSLAKTLKNPFYIGIIRLKSTKELFPGVHQPIISKRLYDDVQDVLMGKKVRGRRTHEFLFRRLLKCKYCGYSLIGERQKGNVYYRCHSRKCPPTSIREEPVNAKISKLLSLLRFTKEEEDALALWLIDFKQQWRLDRMTNLEPLKLNLGKIKERQKKLTDIYIDGRLDREFFETRSNELILEKKGLEEKIEEIRENRVDVPAEIENFLELCKTSYFLYETGVSEEKREIIKKLTSNCVVGGKRLYFSMLFPFQEVANREKKSNGGPSRSIHRTLDELANQWIMECDKK